MKFILYWKTGEKQIVEGRNVAEAMTLAGYSAGALGALDFYQRGAKDKWIWNVINHKWEKNKEKCNVYKINSEH